MYLATISSSVGLYTLMGFPFCGADLTTDSHEVGQSILLPLLVHSFDLLVEAKIILELFCPVSKQAEFAGLWGDVLGVGFHRAVVAASAAFGAIDRVSTVAGAVDVTSWSPAERT